MQHMNGFLRNVDMRSIVFRTPCRLAHSPLLEYLHLETYQHNPELSRELSTLSDDSIDSILAHSAHLTIAEDIAMLPASPTQSDINNIVFKLCCSLYKRALAKTQAHHSRRSDAVTVDAAHEKNMSRVTAWMPLLHLFEPKTFYAIDWARKAQSPTSTRSNASPSTSPIYTSFPTRAALTQAARTPRSNRRDDDFHRSHLSADEAKVNATAGDDGGGGLVENKGFSCGPHQLIANTPREASRKLLDELDVEKLAGGNSNHVYHLNHPQYPDNSILLRVYGSGSNEAIDRYRDTMAMKLMSKAALSPAVLHTFKWGRVEEYMSDVVTATTAMMLASPRLLARIYRSLHAMHQLPVDSFFPAMVHRETFPQLAHTAAEGVDDEAHHNSSNADNNDTPACFLVDAPSPEEYCRRNAHRLTAILAHDAAAGGPADYYAENTSEKVLEDFCPSGFERMAFRFLRLGSSYIGLEHRRAFTSFICAEIMQLRGWLQQRQVPLVFAHNDLNPGNILLSKRMVPRPTRNRRPRRASSGDVAPCAHVSSEEDAEEEDEVMSVLSDCTSSLHCTYLTRKGRRINLVDWKGLLFIDFEYSDVNYRCYDLGNTLCEMDYDYSVVDGVNSEAGFIKYLHRYPPEGYEMRWVDEPMEYPRMPELIYDAWIASTNSRVDAPRGEGADAHDDTTPARRGDDPLTARSSSTLMEAMPKDESDIDAHDIGSSPHMYRDDLSIGHSCLQALEAYFRGTEEKPLRPLTLEQLTEVYIGMLASHLTWFLWSIVLGCNPDTCTNNTNDDDSFARGSSGLNYIQYANCRWREYSSLKEWMQKKSLL